MQSSVIFPLFYLPPISYFKDLLSNQDEAVFEVNEHYIKQSYRNRATVLSPNGKLDLIVPVIRGNSVAGHTKMKDLKISYDANWQRLHWRSIEACYRSSAYFEYYESEFSKFYTRKFDYLIELNIESTDWILQKMKRTQVISRTSDFDEYSDSANDRRLAYSPKGSKDYDPKTYFQVFDDRNGFHPDLSIIDLLFNQGPRALQYI